VTRVIQLCIRRRVAQTISLKRY